MPSLRRASTGLIQGPRSLLLLGAVTTQKGRQVQRGQRGNASRASLQRLCTSHARLLRLRSIFGRCAASLLIHTRMKVSQDDARDWHKPSG